VTDPVARDRLAARDIYEAWAAAVDRQGRVLAPERRTWDLLPAGATGVYWADGVPLESTLAR